MNLLEHIVKRKYLEVRERKTISPVSALGKSGFFSKKPKSLKKAILTEGSSGIIAEFKRKSPSKGIINEFALAGEVCAGYENSGSCAVSVLTNKEFFGGSVDDLAEACRAVSCPVLCKDFIIDEYQVIEARSSGADAILLISDILSPDMLDKLYRFTLSLGMEALIEVHNKKFLSAIPNDAGIVGVNSRDLASLNVSLSHSLELANLLPVNVVKVAESGIRSIDDYFELKRAGFNGFLIGESFMCTVDPGEACRAFIASFRNTV